jgi:hypothetical protein
MRRSAVPALLSAGLLASLSCGAEAFDYCSQSDRGTILFVDVTSGVSKNDRREIAEAAGQIVVHLLPGARFSARTITDRYTASATVFDGCAPGCDSDKNGMLSQCNAQAAKLDRIAWQRAIANDLSAALSELGALDRSEILLTLATTLAGRDLAGWRVLIYSDLIENSALMPFVSRDYVGELRRKMDWLKEKFPDLSLAGAEVVVFGFGRFHDTSRSDLTPALLADLRTAWQEFFAALGSTDVTVEYRWE